MKVTKVVAAKTTNFACHGKALEVIGRGTVLDQNSEHLQCILDQGKVAMTESEVCLKKPFLAIEIVELVQEESEVKEEVVEEVVEPEPEVDEDEAEKPKRGRPKKSD